MKNKMREQLRKIKWVLFFVALEFVTIETLVFPRYSVMQITAAFSIPVELSHERKFFFDWGFQQNYDLPWNSSSFYNIPIWPGFKDNKVRQRRDLKYEVSQEGVHPNDFTAGEFYEALESLLVSYGFHETCLLKSVCQLARHPFDENHNNVLNEILTFILRLQLSKIITVLDIYILFIFAVPLFIKRFLKMKNFIKQFMKGLKGWDLEGKNVI
ncbi:hypothetical protein ACFFRR_001015 [Megaselia abdita]